MSKTAKMLSVIFAGLFLLAGCTTTTSSQTNNDDQSPADYTIELSSFKFSPNLIEANPGQTIKVRLSNLSGEHDFVIDELNVRSELLGAGDSQTIEIKIPEAASGKIYEFYCAVSNHRAMGMVGTLRIK